MSEDRDSKECRVSFHCESSSGHVSICFVAQDDICEVEGLIFSDKFSIDFAELNEVKYNYRYDYSSCEVKDNYLGRNIQSNEFILYNRRDKLISNLVLVKSIAADWKDHVSKYIKVGKIYVDK